VKESQQARALTLYQAPSEGRVNERKPASGGREQGGYSRAVGNKGGDSSGQRKNARERGALTLCQGRESRDGERMPASKVNSQAVEQEKLQVRLAKKS
jgi:hypothetical protein